MISQTWIIGKNIRSLFADWVTQLMSVLFAFTGYLTSEWGNKKNMALGHGRADGTHRQQYLHGYSIYYMLPD